MAIPTGTVFSSTISEKKSTKSKTQSMQADDFHHETIGTEVIVIATDGNQSPSTYLLLTLQVLTV